MKLGVVPWKRKVVSVLTQLYLSRGYWAPFFVGRHRNFLIPIFPDFISFPRARSNFRTRDTANGVYSSLFRGKASGGHSKARQTRDGQVLQKFARFALIAVTSARARVCKCPPPQIPVSQSPFQWIDAIRCTNFAQKTNASAQLWCQIWLRGSGIKKEGGGVGNDASMHSVIFDSARVRGALRCYDAIDRVEDRAVVFLARSSLWVKSERSRRRQRLGSFTFFQYQSQFR